MTDWKPMTYGEWPEIEENKNWYIKLPMVIAIIIFVIMLVVIG